MSKVTDVRVVDRQEAAGLPELSDELRVALTDIAAVAREGLLAMSVAVLATGPAVRRWCFNEAEAAYIDNVDGYGLRQRAMAAEQAML